MKEKKEKSPHDQRRQRMRERVFRHGLDSLHDHECIEVLLYGAIPRGDVNPIAHALLREFGSLSAVLEAPPHTLQAVHGVGPQAAFFLSLVGQLTRRCIIDKLDKKSPLDSIERVEEYITPFFWGYIEERVLVSCLDAKNRVFYQEEIAKGTVSSVGFNYRRMCEIGVEKRAFSLMVAHNHPGGQALPSMSDIAITQRMVESLAPLNIRLFDHVIVVDDAICSMRQQGRLGQIEETLQAERREKHPY